MILWAIGFFFLTASLLLLGYDLTRLGSDGDFQFTALGDYWFALHRGSLNLMQAVIQRYLWPVLWDPIITWVLLRPAWVISLVVSAAFLMPAYVRRNRGG